MIRQVLILLDVAQFNQIKRLTTQATLINLSQVSSFQKVNTSSLYPTLPNLQTHGCIFISNKDNK